MEKVWFSSNTCSRNGTKDFACHLALPRLAVAHVVLAPNRGSSHSPTGAGSPQPPYPGRHRRLVRVLQGPFSATCRKIFFSPISNIIQVLGSVAKVSRIICFSTLFPNDLRCPGTKWRSCTLGAGWIAVVVSLCTAVVYSWESCHNYSTVAVRVYLYFSEFAQLHVSYV